MTPFTAALLSTMFLSSITHIHSTNPSINTQYQTTNIPIGSFEISLSIPTTSEDKLLRHDEEFSPRSYTPPKLYITDTVTNKTIWSSPDGSSFLSAAEVDFKVKQNSGYFNFDSHTKHLCQELYITNWTSVDDVTSHSTPMDSYTRSVDPSSGSSSTSAPGRDPVLSASLVTLSGRMCDKQEVEVVFRVFNVSGFAQLSVSMALLGEEISYNQLILLYAKLADERMYGFGHQYTEFDLSGKQFPVFSTEQGVGRGREPLTKILNALDPGSGGEWYTTYTHIPFYTSSKQNAFFLESQEYVVFNLEASTVTAINLMATNFTFRLFGGCRSIPDYITSYTAYSGRMAQDTAPDTITQGAILGLEGGTSAVLARTNKLCDLAKSMWPSSPCPVSALWLQDWTGERNFTLAGKLQRIGLWWVWELDESHYPGFAQFVSDMRERGIATLIYFNPMITDITRRGTPFKNNFYQEALKSGYFVKNKDGKVWTGYNEAALLDLTNPSAVQWMENILTAALLDTGAVGHMHDFGEALPLDGHLYHGDGHVLHNQYPTMWARLSENATERCREKTGLDYMYFMRSSGSFTHSHTTHYWMGDQLVTFDDFDGMRSAIVAMLSAGLSGHSLVHTDIGGYANVDIADIKYIRSELVLKRWCELAVFTSVFRTHLGTLPDAAWQNWAQFRGPFGWFHLAAKYNVDSNEETARFFLTMAKLFQAFQLYREELRTSARIQGWPMVRPMIFTFWDCKPLYDVNLRYEQFMFGSSFLVAPVTTNSSNATELSVWLPKDTKWVYGWDSSIKFEGNNTYVNVTSYLGQPAFFVRQPLPEASWVERFRASLNELGVLNVP